MRRVLTGMPLRMSTWDCHIRRLGRSFLLKDLGITFGKEDVHVKGDKIGRANGIKQREWSSEGDGLSVVITGLFFSQFLLCFSPLSSSIISFTTSASSYYISHSRNFIIYLLIVS